jgi:hypothetical protein
MSTCNHVDLSDRVEEVTSVVSHALTAELLGNFRHLKLQSSISLFDLGRSVLEETPEAPNLLDSDVYVGKVILRAKRALRCHGFNLISWRIETDRFGKRRLAYAAVLLDRKWDQYRFLFWAFSLLVVTFSFGLLREKIFLPSPSKWNAFE